MCSPRAAALSPIAPQSLISYLGTAAPDLDIIIYLAAGLCENE
jgi:hypothetical protein